MSSDERNQKFYPANRPNIIVTGGAGFIGSHLCESLIQNNNVICIDSLIASENYKNLETLLQSPNFYFIKHDINQPIDLLSFPELQNLKIKFQGIQEIYHLACPTSAKNFDQFKVDTLKANSLGMVNILELAMQYQAKVLFTSSSVVYGRRQSGQSSLKEIDLGQVDFTGGRACYDEGKRFAETICFTYRQKYNLDVKVARIFRTYGPRLALFDGQMVADFVLQAINNKPMIIYGDANFDTSLCYVSDIVEGILALMGSKENGPINLGHPQKYFLVDVAKKIIDATSSSSSVEYREPLVFMSPLGLPDISLAKEKLSWFPVVTIDDGLRRTIEYIKAHRLLFQPLVAKYEE